VSRERVTIDRGKTAAITKRSVPTQFALEQNYPNPFNSATIIRYELPKSVRSTLKLYNLRGQVVRTLLDRQQGAGYYTIDWDGKDDAGRMVPSGVYVYTLTAGEFRASKKLLLIR